MDSDNSPTTVCTEENQNTSHPASENTFLSYPSSGLLESFSSLDQRKWTGLLQSPLGEVGGVGESREGMWRAGIKDVGLLVY